MKFDDIWVLGKDHLYDNKRCSEMKILGVGMLGVDRKARMAAADHPKIPETLFIQTLLQ
jgi:hypothetical protein